MTLLKNIFNMTTCTITFLYLALLINPAQMLSALIRPFSTKAFRAVNNWCARSIFGIWVLMAEKDAKIELVFTGDEIPKRENAILICNHQSMADVMLLLCFAWRCCRIGDIKFFVKDIIKYIPGVGWGMHFLDCIYVKRNWTQDKAGIQKLFGKFKREQIPIFLVSFLEGTRVKPSKLKKAQAFAASRGMYVPQHTLVPRTKGFVASMQGLGDHLNAVYDMTIGYPEGVPRLVDCYLHKVKRIEINIKRYPIADFAEMDEAQLNTWVFDRYQEKDKRLAAFAKTGAFEDEPSLGPIHYKEWLAGLH